MEYKTTAKHILLQAKVSHDTQFYRIKGGVGMSQKDRAITSSELLF